MTRAQSRWSRVAAFAGAGILLAALVLGNRTALGLALTALGCLTLVDGLRRDNGELHEGLRTVAGPGWLLGRLLSLVPGVAGKVVYALMCVGIIALGLSELI